MSYVDLMANHRWSEADIQCRQRAVIASVIPADRQQELQTIMLGHLSGMRVATPEELAETTLVKNVTLAAYTETLAARVDAALLNAALDVEQGLVAPEDASPEVQALLALRAAARPAEPEPVPVPEEPPPGERP